MKNGKLTIDTGDLKDFFTAVCFMASVVNGHTQYVDHFDEDEIRGFKVVCKTLAPLVFDISEVIYQKEGFFNELKCNGDLK